MQKPLKTIPPIPYKVQVNQDFSGGENTRDDPSALATGEMSEAYNIIVTFQKSIQSRQGCTVVGSNTQSAAVTMLYAYYNEDTDTREQLRQTGTVLEYRVGDSLTWTTVTGVSLTAGLFPSAVTFKGMTGSSLKTGTASSSTTNTLVTTGLTADAYINKAITITSGTGSGQTRLITANSTTTVTVAEFWDTNPDGTSNYAIYNVSDQVYITNGTDTPVRYDSATHLCTSLTAWKKYSWLTVYKDRIFGMGTDGEKDTFRWSTFGLGDDFRKNAYQEVQTRDGSNLIAAVALSKGMVLFKDYSVHRLSGDNPENFVLDVLDDSVGCVAPNSIREYKGMVYFLSHRGIERSNGVNVSRDPISDKIRPNMDAIRSEYRGNSSGAVFDNKYFLVVSKNASSTTKDYVYVLDLLFNAWTEWEFNGIDPNIMNTYLNGSGKMCLFMGSATDSYVYQLYSGDSDNGATIEKYFSTNRFSGVKYYSIFRFSPNNTAMTKSFDRIYLHAISSDQNQSVSVFAEYDSSGFELASIVDISRDPIGLPQALPFTLPGSGMVNERIDLIAQAQTIRYKFYINDSKSPVRILGYTTRYRDISMR